MTEEKQADSEPSPVRKEVTRKGSPARRRGNKGVTRRRRRSKRQKGSRKERFSGREAILKASVYDVATSRQAMNGFTRTTNEVVIFTG